QALSRIPARLTESPISHSVSRIRSHIRIRIRSRSRSRIRSRSRRRIAHGFAKRRERRLEAAMRFFKLRAVGHGGAAGSVRLASVSRFSTRSETALVIVAFLAAIFVFAGVVIGIALTIGSVGVRAMPRSDRIAMGTALFSEGI